MNNTNTDNETLQYHPEEKADTENKIIKTRNYYRMI